MKYVVIIPDGAGDQPIPELGNRTPLEAAVAPNLARLAGRGRVARVVTTPPGFEAGSDVCSMCLLGYDPSKFHTGRAPLEAASLGLNPGERDWIFRVNLVTIGPDAPGPDQGLMLDHSAGAISDGEARALVGVLDAEWKSRAPELARDLTLTPGVSYRNILVDASGADYAGATTTPPHSIPREPWRDALPRGESGRLCTLMEIGRRVFEGHEVNRSRVARGQRPANMPWIWGQGTRPRLPRFSDRFGLRGAMITSVDLLAGIGAYMGLERLDVPGLTSYHDNDYRAQGLAACEAVSDFDFVCCHVESPDEASHQGDWRTKVAAIEAIDREIVGPLSLRLEREGDEGWRVLVMPDHYTLASTKKHDPTPVPALMAGAWIRSLVAHPFTERGSFETDLVVDPGHELMEFFIEGGLARVGGGVGAEHEGGRKDSSARSSKEGARRHER